jgi:hypothetical protein
MGLGQAVRKVLFVAASIGALAPPLIATTAGAAPAPTPPPACVGTERLTQRMGNDVAATGGAMSGDGSFFVFATTEKLVQTDPPLKGLYSNLFGVTRGQPDYELISVDQSGAQILGLDENTQPAVTPDGRFVAFRVYDDLWIRDRHSQVTDFVDLPPTTVGDLKISANGRVVTFASGAALLPADQNGSQDVYLFDRETRALELVSVATSGGQGSGGQYGFRSRAAISDDGQKIVYATSQSGLVLNDTNGVADVFLRDRTLGTTTRLSVSAGGAQLSAASSDPVISGDGTYVAFASASDAIVADDANGVSDVFGRAVGSAASIALLSRTPSGPPADGGSRDPDLGQDDSAVAFTSAANNLVPGTGGAGWFPTEVPSGYEDVFVVNRVSDLVTIASVDDLGQDRAGLPVMGSQLSEDGSHVLFTTGAPLSSDDNDGTAPDVFLRRVDAPTILGAAPVTAHTGEALPLEIAGSGFRPGAEVTGAAGTTISVDAVTNNVIDATLHVSPNAPAGIGGATVTDEHGCTASVDGLYEVVDLSGDFTPVASARLLDTRAGAPLGAGQTLSLDVTGVAGVPEDVDSVAVNVTVTGASAGGYLTVFPGGTARPGTSTVNFTPGVTLANLAMPKVGPTGEISIFNQSGTVQVIVDVMGYYSSVAGPAGSRLATSSPFRVIDTRNEEAGAMQPGEIYDLFVGTDVAAIVANVTVTQPTANGWVTAWSGEGPATTSTLNFAPGQTVANAAVIPVAADGWVSFQNAVGQSHLIVDVMGEFVGPGDASQQLTGLTPARVLDTRSGGAPVPHGGTYHLTVAGVGGIPADAATVVVNVTGVRLSGTGWVTAYPSGTPLPNTSNLNLTSGQIAANLVIVPVGADGAIDLNNQGGPTHLIVDVVGYFR